MSNEKTIVPGMGNPYLDTPPVNGRVTNHTGTHFPGMRTDNLPGNPISENRKPIMGFLFSVSRDNCGEFWPLYMGLNTVGRSTNCSVRLSEATISDNHAEIVIRQMRNPDSVVVSIRDSRSTCGTLINGSSLGFDAQECHNGDIITFGEHYEFYFILIDTKSLGLETKNDFIPVGAVPNMPPIGAFGYTPTSPLPSQVPQQHTVFGGGAMQGTTMNGSQPVNNGGTKIMPGIKK